MLELKNLGVHKIYQVNICSVYKMDINLCFFFVCEISKWEYKFKNTRQFPLHWKKHLSKKLIDYILTLDYYYWFSTNCLWDINFEEKICELFVLYSPINISIREYDV